MDLLVRARFAFYQRLLIAMARQILMPWERGVGEWGIAWARICPQERCRLAYRGSPATTQHVSRMQRSHQCDAVAVNDGLGRYVT